MPYALDTGETSSAQCTDKANVLQLPAMPGVPFGSAGAYSGHAEVPDGEWEETQRRFASSVEDIQWAGSRGACCPLGLASERTVSLLVSCCDVARKRREHFLHQECPLWLCSIL